MEQTAIITIQPGSNCPESLDFAVMLQKMYRRWAERNRVNVVRLHIAAGSEPCVIELNGESVNDRLQWEVGVHRLVRVSPFDPKLRRHTSFAQVFLTEEPGLLGRGVSVEAFRTYMFHPESLAKDYRTGRQIRDVGRILDGEIELLQ